VETSKTVRGGRPLHGQETSEEKKIKVNADREPHEDPKQMWGVPKHSQGQTRGRKTRIEEHRTQKGVGSKHRAQRKEKDV